MMKKMTAGLLFACLSASAHAAVVVTNAWVRATVAQQTATGAIMQIRSDKDVRLVEVQTAAAGMAEVHEMKMDNDIMKMRALPQLELTAGKAVEFKPGQLHIMLMDLKGQAKVGDTIPLSLIFEDKNKKRETVQVRAVVKRIGE